MNRWVIVIDVLEMGKGREDTRWQAIQNPLQTLWRTPLWSSHHTTGRGWRRRRVTLISSVRDKWPIYEIRKHIPGNRHPTLTPHFVTRVDEWLKRNFRSSNFPQWCSEILNHPLAFIPPTSTFPSLIDGNLSMSCANRHTYSAISGDSFTIVTRDNEENDHRQRHHHHQHHTLRREELSRQEM